MKRISTFLFLLFAMLLQNAEAYSQAGTLDPSFGNNGIALFSPGTQHSTAWDMVMLEDTSTILCATAQINGATAGILMRVLPDGSQDMSFGSSGLVVMQYGTSTYNREIRLQDDGKLLVGGMTYVTAADGDFFLARFNPDGSPDLTFNSTGHVIPNYSTAEESLEAFTLQNDGKYVLAGRTYLGSFSQLLFARVNSDGTLDVSFGTNGYTEINASVQDEAINSVEVMNDGTIIGFGYGYQSSPYWGELLFMTKLTSTGAPAPGFGTNGVLIPPVFDDISSANDFIIDGDSLFVTGYMYDVSNNMQFFIAKLDEDGNAYTSFGNNGITFLLIDPVTIGIKIARMGDNKFYISGTTGLGGPNNRDFLLIRVLPDGTLDTGFNGTGYVETDIQPAWDEAYGLALQPDGKIVLAGMSSGFPSNPNSVGMTRYLNDFTPAGCYANFIADDVLICEGNPVNFTDLTVSTDSTVLNWEWTFEGGTPGSSTIQNPTITYTAAGIYDVTLAVYDGIYYDTLTMEDYITVEAIPATPGTPSGLSELCGGYDADYTTTPVTYADEYDWQVTPSSAGTISGNTTTATFVASSTFTGTATIQVRAEGMCGNSPWSPGLSIEIFHSPESFNMTGDGAFCEGSPGAEIGLDGSETGVDYELYLAGSPTGNIVAGTGSALSFGTLSTIGLYTVSGYTDHCSESMIGQVYVHMQPLPEQANTPNGPTTVCDHDYSTYVTLQIDDADVYIWTLTPAESGEMTVVFDTAHIAWTEGWTGKAHLSVHGENTCGAGAESEELEIDVYLDPEPEVSGPDTVCSGFEEIYETANNPGSFYTWVVEGGVVTSGPGTHQVTILWGDPGNGWITVMEETEAGCSTTTEAFEVTIEECIFVEELSADLLKIYPNPVNANLNVNIFAGSFSEITLSVHTISGKTMLESTILYGSDQTNYSIDVSHLPPGMYLLKVISKEGSLITGKFIKN